MPNFFGNYFAERLATASQTATTLPYLADQQTVGRFSEWATGAVCRLVTNFAPSKWQNADFAGYPRSGILAFAGYFGSPETKNIDTLRSRVWLTMPLEYLTASSVQVFRRIYDSSSQNFHAEVDVKRVVDQTCQLAVTHCKRKNDRTSPEALLREKIEPIIGDKIREAPLSWATTCGKMAAVAGPEIMGQLSRIALVTGFWSMYTDSPYLSTFWTVSTLTATTSLFGTHGPMTQGSIFAVQAATLLFISGNEQWMSTTLSVAHLAIWWGLLAKGKTAELATYKPPESANRAAKVVQSEEGAILDAVREVLNPEKDMRPLQDDLAGVRFQAYPFTAFDDRPASEPREGKRGVRFKSSSASTSASASAPEKQPHEVAEEKRKAYEASHRDYKKHPEYWGLMVKEYEAKVKLFWNNDWNKAVSCIMNIERARFAELNLLPDVDQYNKVKATTLRTLDRFLSGKSADGNLKNNKRLQGLRDEVADYKHKDHV